MGIMYLIILKTSGSIKNQAADESVNLNLIARNALLDQMIEVGSGAHPVFFDYNNDSLMDIIIANYGYYTEREL